MPDSMTEAQAAWLDGFLGGGRPRIAPRLPGTYRATVVRTDDPFGHGRIQVSVPDRGEGSCWAARCQPPGTPDTPPAVGAAGWVTFEHGDPEFPVWMGTRAA